MTLTKTVPIRRRLPGAWTVFLIVWTLLALAALYFVWHLPPGDVRVVNSTEGFLGQGDWWYLFHVNFHAIYPILLLAPYVVFVSWRWTFGITRWWLALPIHLLCAAAMLPGARMIDRRVTEAMPSLVYVSGASLKLGKVSVGSKVIALPIEISEGAPTEKAGNVGIVIDVRELTIPKKSTTTAKPSARNESNPKKWAKADQEGLLIPAVGFLVISGLAHATSYHRRFRLRENQAAQLESQLTRSRLAVLQSQLHPHFLFNTLNGIVTLIRHRPIVAEEMITSLSSLLRTALDSSRRRLIPLSREIAFLERYLALQHMRFEDRLAVTWNIHPDTVDVPLPALLLQPLVENAIIHGIEPSANPGRLDIAASLEGGEVVITLVDNGVGFELGSPPRGTGQGTANVRELLELFYPQQHQFDITSQPGEGTCITLRFPVKPSAEDVLP